MNRFSYKIIPHFISLSRLLLLSLLVFLVLYTIFFPPVLVSFERRIQIPWNLIVFWEFKNRSSIGSCTESSLYTAGFHPRWPEMISLVHSGISSTKGDWWPFHKQGQCHKTAATATLCVTVTGFMECDIISMNYYKNYIFKMVTRDKHERGFCSIAAPQFCSNTANLCSAFFCKLCLLLDIYVVSLHSLLTEATTLIKHR